MIIKISIEKLLMNNDFGFSLNTINPVENIYVNFIANKAYTLDVLKTNNFSSSSGKTKLWNIDKYIIEKHIDDAESCHVLIIIPLFM